MEELRSLFGEESLTFSQFLEKLNESGMKLVNIKAGGYVDKNKFDKLQSDFEKYKAENDVSKYADYDALKKEVETLKAEKAEVEFGAEVTAAGVDDKFKKFVLSEVKPLVTEEKDFKTALAEYVKDNAQFLKKEPNPVPNPTFKFGSQGNHEGGSYKDEDLEKLDMKDYIKARSEMK